MQHCERGQVILGSIKLVKWKFLGSHLGKSPALNFVLHVFKDIVKTGLANSFGEVCKTINDSLKIIHLKNKLHSIVILHKLVQS